MTENTDKLEFYKDNESDIIFWVDNMDCVGQYLFTFDKKKIYNLFEDYPHNLTAKELQIFDKENPFWCDFFSGRKKT